MTICNILVAYNGSASSDAALKAAFLMHKKYGTHVTGLMAMPSRVDIQGRPWLPDTIQKAIVDLDRDHIKAIEARFRDQCRDFIVPDKTHWIARRSASDAAVSEYAHMYDLTVVGRGDSIAEEKRLELHPDRIAVKSGRPVLVIPQGWSEQLFSEHALLAWDGNRSATRALADAMQILETKQLVTVLSVAGRDLGKELKGIDVETVLGRHGIKIDRVSIEARNTRVSDILIEECVSRNAGLLVMGAYEHSKFREDLIGGVTNDVLRNCPVPMLLSH